jgi:hypothetical protein
MITRVKDVVAEDPIRYIWKNLRYFLDAGFVESRITEIHGEEAKKHKKNVEKQAIQIGYCIRQAEEYFRAASQVSLATRPNLLYYGGVSLTKALILLQKDGTCSFDALRESEKHKHHGLELKEKFKNIKVETGPTSFFGSISCRCYTHKHKDDFNHPWGHFPLFYDSLTPTTFSLEAETHVLGTRAPYTASRAFPCSGKAPIKDLISKNLNALALMKSLPDLYDTMQQFSMGSDLWPGKTKVSISVSCVQNEEQEAKETMCHADFSHYFYGVQTTRIDELKTRYNRDFRPWRGHTAPGVYTKAFINYMDPTVGTPPLTCNTDNNGNLYYIMNEEVYLHETASLFVLLFCFGMMSRYHADIWMEAIDKQVQIREIIDDLLNIYDRKFPNLILNQLTSTHYNVRMT